MIITFTPNPSIDATLALGEQLHPGQLHRAIGISRVAGGKGVNVSHVLHLAGQKTLALFPAGPYDYFLSLIRTTGVPYSAVEMDNLVRTNTTLTEPGGRTTKANNSGPFISASTQRDLEIALAKHAKNARWVVLAGSLPQGVPAGWYADLISIVRTNNPTAKIALDTSDAPLRALASHLPAAAPDLIKPNGLELGQLASVDGLRLEEAAKRGDFLPVVRAARSVIDQGIPQILATVGRAGAVLVTADEAWAATSPPVEVKSTVGAGDSCLAGFIVAQTLGKTLPDSVAYSAAYGSAAAGLPGTQLPHPHQLNLAATTVTRI